MHVTSKRLSLAGVATAIALAAAVLALRQEPSLPPDPAQAIAQLRAQLDEKVAAHRSAPRGEPWASRTEAVLRAEILGAAPARHFKLDSLECRHDTCLVAVAWPSEREAQELWPQVLTMPLSLNCARDMVLSPPAPARHAATLLLACEGAGVSLQ